MANECRLRLEWVPEAYKEPDGNSSKPVSASQKLVKPLVRDGASLKVHTKKYKR